MVGSLTNTGCSRRMSPGRAACSPSCSTRILACGPAGSHSYWSTGRNCDLPLEIRSGGKWTQHSQAKRRKTKMFQSRGREIKRGIHTFLFQSYGECLQWCHIETEQNILHLIKYQWSQKKGLYPCKTGYIQSEVQLSTHCVQKVTESGAVSKWLVSGSFTHH